MRNRLVAAMVLVVALGWGGCLDDPQGVVFGQNDADLDVGIDAADDVGEVDTGDVEGPDADGSDADASDADDEDVDEPDTCVPGEDGCGPAHCGNGQLDGDESDVDCGGSCEGCEEGGECRSNDDCSDEELLELLQCDYDPVEICEPRGTGLYQRMVLICNAEGAGQARCVATDSGADPVSVPEDAACPGLAEGDRCGEESVEYGECVPLQDEPCGTGGERRVTTTGALCLNGSCSVDVTVSLELCVRVPQSGDVCEATLWSAWGACEIDADSDSCSPQGVQTRQRNVSYCSDVDVCDDGQSEIQIETRRCSRNPDPSQCVSSGSDSGDFVCDQEECCSRDCSATSRSCRDRVSDGCGGQCEPMPCTGGLACALDGQCRGLCLLSSGSATCQFDAQCESVCACPLGVAPECERNACTCL